MSVIPGPAPDSLLPDQIKGPDQLHSLEIGAVKLGHHGLDLAAVEHPHQDGLDHVIIVMAQGNFVAAQLLCFGIEMASAHSGTEIAGGIHIPRHYIKDL